MGVLEGLSADPVPHAPSHLPACHGVLAGARLRRRTGRRMQPGRKPAYPGLSRERSGRVGWAAAALERNGV